LAFHFQSIDKLRNADFEALIKVDEIGERIAQSWLNWLEENENIEILNRLSEAGVSLEIDQAILAERTDVLEGKSFVISGIFTHHTRDELKKLIDKNGGKNTSSISKKTTYLIAGDNMGPSKREKAEKLDISIISENEFIDLLT
jgi:DNA ligase (NAD+)